MLNNLGFALDGAWRVLLAGLVLGAGLPALFALGIRALAWGGGATTAGENGATTPASGPGPRPRPLGTFLGWLLFAVVILGVLLGITFIVATGFGKALSFNHLYPTIVPKH